MKIDRLTIVGVGLIGGSVGLAAKGRGLAGFVRGVGRSRENLDLARRLGAIDGGSLDLVEGVQGADLVVFCTPVDRIADQVLAAAPHCAGALLTDAGSTKAEIVRQVESRLAGGTGLPTRLGPKDGLANPSHLSVAFVGSHPLAGSEKRGAEHADADLFAGRLTVVTPTARTHPQALERTCAFWQSLGARVRIMSPEDHDRALAWTSHLPHLAAAALAGVLPQEWFDLTATGFRDTTRVAAGDPELWTAIFAANRAAVLAALGPLQARLEEFERALEHEDWPAVDSLLAQARKVRHALEYLDAAKISGTTEAQRRREKKE